MRARVSDMLVNILVTHNFKMNSSDMREAMGEMHLTNYLSIVGDEKSIKFSGLFNSMISHSLWRMSLRTGCALISCRDKSEY